jgi:hypothetical protein
MSAIKQKSGIMREHSIQLSIHYYVLSLNEQKTRLYEGFRDQLIDIQNTKFPFQSSAYPGASGKPDSNNTRLKEFFRDTNRHFAHYFGQDPLRLVVVGERMHLDIFKALTTHQDVIVGTVEGDYTDTSSRDLGKIVWPVVKEAMTGANKRAMHDLATAVKEKKVVYGINAVGASVETKAGSTLYVEEDYHVKGSIRKTDRSQIITKHVSLWVVIDDVVDLIIEKALKMRGTVIFLNSGSLIKLERIALIMPG